MPVTREEALAELARRGEIPPQAGQFDAAGFEDLGKGFKRNKLGQVYREGPKGGFSQVSGPNATMVAKATEAAKGVDTALQALDRVDKQYRNTKVIGPLGVFTNNADLAVLQQSVKDLQLRLKEQPYGLGVLNGPDLQILETIVQNPGSIRNAAFRKSIYPTLQNLAKILGDQYRQEAEQFAAQGGQKGALQPLYRAPDSQFSPDEWGTEGRVKPKAGAPVTKPSTTGAKPAHKMTDAEIKAMLGL